MTSNQSGSTASGWTAREIREALPEGAMSRIARRLGKDYSAVSHVVSGRIRSARIEGEIARTLRIKRALIFPVRRERGTGTEAA